MSWKRLIQVLSYSRINTMTPFFQYLFHFFLFLNTLCPGHLVISIYTSSSHLWIIRYSLITLHLFFMQEMVSCCNSIMPISFYTFHSIVIFKPVLILHQFKYLFVIRHFFFTRKEPELSLFFLHSIPWMFSNVFNRISGFRIRI